jgi:hypothetical protein
MATINLSVVGIYFSAAITVNSKGPITALDVLEAARLQDRNFGFKLDSFNTVGSISYFHPADFKSKRSQIGRAKGMYTIDDSKVGPYGIVWQYYVQDKSGVVVKTKSEPVGSSVAIPDQGTLTFRAISILEGPVETRGKV